MYVTRSMDRAAGTLFLYSQQKWRRVWNYYQLSLTLSFNTVIDLHSQNCLNLSYICFKSCSSWAREFKSSRWDRITISLSPETYKSYSCTDTGRHVVMFILSSSALIKALPSAPYVRIQVAVASYCKAFHCSLSYLMPTCGCRSWVENMGNVQEPVARRSCIHWYRESLFKIQPCSHKFSPCGYPNYLVNRFLWTFPNSETLMCSIKCLSKCAWNM